MQVQGMTIYKKTTVTALLFLIFYTFTFLPCRCCPADNRDYIFAPADYSHLDSKKIRSEAEKDFHLYFNTSDKLLKEKYLNSTMNKYYILSQINPGDIDAYIKLGKIYDEKNISELAKTYFYKALNINKEMALANFYFGDYYYKRNDYKKALYHYKIAYKNGVAKTYDFNLKLATIYEKLADLSNAKKFYEISYNIKADSRIGEKIQLLNELHYDKSDYYHNIREYKE